MKTIITWVLTFLVQEHSIALKPKGPPQAEKDYKELKIIKQVGKEINLRCPITGNPHPLFTWKKNKPENLDRDYTRIITDKKILRIGKAQINDSGEYICKATNGFGNLETKIDLVVVHPEELSIINEEARKVAAANLVGRQSTFNKLILENEDLEPLCMFWNGYSTPSLTWYKNSLPYQQSGAKTITRRVTKSDEGIYTCRILRNVTKKWNVKFKDLSLRRHSDTSPTNVTVYEGQKITLNCRVSARQKHAVLWLKDSSKLPLADPKSIININNKRYLSINYTQEYYKFSKREDLLYNFILIFPSITSSDSGLYMCLILSGRKGAGIKTSYLKVIPHSAIKNNRTEYTKQITLIIIIFTGLAITILTSSTVGYLTKRILNRSRRGISSDSITLSTRSIVNEQTQEEWPTDLTIKQERRSNHATNYQYPKSMNFKNRWEQDCRIETKMYEPRNLQLHHNEYCRVADARNESYTRQNDAYDVPFTSNTHNCQDNKNDH